MSSGTSGRARPPMVCATMRGVMHESPGALSSAVHVARGSAAASRASDGARSSRRSFGRTSRASRTCPAATGGISSRRNPTTSAPACTVRTWPRGECSGASDATVWDGMHAGHRLGTGQECCSILVLAMRWPPSDPLFGVGWETLELQSISRWLWWYGCSHHGRVRQARDESHAKANHADMLTAAESGIGAQDRPVHADATRRYPGNQGGTTRTWQRE